MEFDTPKRTVQERVKRKLGMVSGRDRDPETGRSYTEERMIAKMHKHGGKAFRIARAAETTMKQYERSAKS